MCRILRKFPVSNCTVGAGWIWADTKDESVAEMLVVTRTRVR